VAGCAESWILGCLCFLSSRSSFLTVAGRRCCHRSPAAAPVVGHEPRAAPLAACGLIASPDAQSPACAGHAETGLIDRDPQVRLTSDPGERGKLAVPRPARCCGSDRGTSESYASSRAGVSCPRAPTNCRRSRADRRRLPVAQSGAKCVGSSGALMLVAFALAAGRLFLMAGITAVMVWEVTPWGARTVRGIGYGLILAGVLVLAGMAQSLPLWA